MNPQIIFTDFKASIKTWTRSTGTLFWTIAFPVILIIIFGAIFSGTGEISYDLYVQDLDNSEMSNTLINILNKTGVIEIISVDEDKNISKFIEKNNIKRLIVIPKNYEARIQQSFNDPTVTVAIIFYLDPSEQTSNQIIRSILSNILQSFNLNLSQGHNVVTLNEKRTITEDFDFIDFFLPGMIGFTIMQTCIYGSIERNTKFRKDGILRKLLTTPITRTEWILAKMLFMLFLSFVSTSLIIFVGIIVWGVTINITPLMIIIVIATSFLFSGIGMLIGRFVKEEETADTAGGAISFPMMFLAGTFFPLDQMPEFLQTFARVLPLYYVNEGLRNAMIYMNESEALTHTIAVIIFASIFFIAGLILTKWSED